MLRAHRHGFPKGLGPEMASPPRDAYKEGKMAVLTAKTRSKIPTGKFALPGRRYPIEDRAHAANARARASQFATPAEKAIIFRKTAKYFGSLKKLGGMA